MCPQPCLHERRNGECQSHVQHHCPSQRRFRTPTHCPIEVHTAHCTTPHRHARQGSPARRASVRTPTGGSALHMTSAGGGRAGRISPVSPLRWAWAWAWARTCGQASLPLPKGKGKGQGPADREQRRPTQGPAAASVRPTRRVQPYVPRPSCRCWRRGPQWSSTDSCVHQHRV